MDYVDQVNAIGLYLIVALVSASIVWLLLYSAIRFGVKHGLRGHTRWIDDGKD
jgi:hypothetical protein